MTPEKEALFDNDFEILQFKNIYKSAQLAMAWYMAVDGEAWSDIWKDVSLPYWKDSFSNPEYHAEMRSLLENALPSLIDKYGDVEFGIGHWPTSEIILSIAHDEQILADQSAQHTLETYKPGRETGSALNGYYRTSYPEENRWPVILSNFDDETLQDGWKRFSLYTQSGYSHTPVIFYPNEWHYELLQRKNNISKLL